MKKEYPILETKRMKAKVGCVYLNNPKLLYLNISSWVVLKDPEDSFNIAKSLVARKTRVYLNRLLENRDELFEHHFVINVDLKEMRLSTDTRSYMSLEVDFFQRDVPRGFKFPEIAAWMKKRAEELSALLEELDVFDFSLKKEEMAAELT